MPDFPLTEMDLVRMEGSLRAARQNPERARKFCTHDAPHLIAEVRRLRDALEKFAEGEEVAKSA